MVDALTAEYQPAALALDDAVITLTESWTGAAANSFRGAWTACTRSSPSTLLSALGDNLAAFSRELRDYADQLEHAQNEHWIRFGLMAALTVLNAAQEAPIRPPTPPRWQSEPDWRSPPASPSQAWVSWPWEAPSAASALTSSASSAPTSWIAQTRRSTGQRGPV